VAVLDEIDLSLRGPEIASCFARRIEEEVEELIHSWNDRQISPMDFEDALAARTRTIEDIIESQLKGNTR
jgi:hypothetical protein